MSAHLPECYNSKRQRFAKPCICDRLRACEQRVMADRLGATYQKWLDEGYAAGVQAARDAVAAEHESASVDYSAGYLLGMKDALAAIDALLEQS